MKKEKSQQTILFNLGKELTKNQQKKIVGGAFIHCQPSLMGCADIGDPLNYCTHAWNTTMWVSC